MTTFISNGEPITQPSPQYDLPIVCNNGVVKVSKNLFDTNQQFAKGYIDDNGDLVDFEGLETTVNYIPVLPNTDYTVSFTALKTAPSNFNISTWTSNGTIIDRPVRSTITSTGQKIYTFTTTATTAKIKVTIWSDPSVLTNFQIEQGSTATPYMPYGQIYVDGTTETVEITGKNLFDYEYFYDNYQMYNASAVGRCPIKLKPNTTYTISTNRNSISNPNSAVMFVVSGNAINWTPNTANNGVTSNSPRTVTTDSNGYLCFGVYVQSANEVPESEFISGTTWVQLEQGSTATTYEPYTVLGTATAENLFKVGDYQDVQSVIDGGVTRNVGIKVLAGTENWSYISGNTPRFRTLINTINDLGLRLTPLYNTHFLCVSDGRPFAQVPNNAIYTGGGIGGEVFIHSSDFGTSVGSFKQFLADQYANGTPVIIAYPLATATTETVTGQPMNIQAGTNIVEITQASIDNLGLEVSYKATV